MVTMTIVLAFLISPIIFSGVFASASFSVNDGVSVMDIESSVNVVGRYDATPLPKLWISDGANVTIGNAAAMTCTAAAGTELYWILPGRSSHRPFSSYVVCKDINISRSILVLLSTSLEDSYGTFKCCVTMKVEHLTDIPCSSVVLPMSTPPILKEYTQVCDEKHCQLSCTFIGNVAADHLSWHGYDGLNWNEIDTDNSSIVPYPNGFTMTANATAISSATDYFPYCKCEASNYAIKSQTFSVIQSYSYPAVTIVGNTYESGVITLSCEIACNPQPSSIYWLKESLIQQSAGAQYFDDLHSDSKYRVTVTNLTSPSSGYYKYKSEFSFGNRVDTDSAIYRCYAENAAGIGQANTTIDIMPSSSGKLSNRITSSLLVGLMVAFMCGLCRQY